MLARPNPSRLTTLIDHEEVLQHRNLFCPCYDPCLDVALAQHWTSWTCARCEFFLSGHGLDIDIDIEVPQLVSEDLLAAELEGTAG